MRDLLLTLFIFGSLPFIFSRPYLGVIMFVWIGVMNPHRLSWGFAYFYPFAQVVAIVTILGLLFEPRKLRFPWTSVTILLFLFVLWMNVTTLFALIPDQAYDQWSKVMKIMLMVFVPLVALYKREHIEWMIWACALSLAFYGTKGGIFTLRGGAADLVWGPAGSFIEDNNGLAMALTMTIPLLWYMRMQARNRWIRHALLASMALCTVSVFGSYSRGALLAICAMSFCLWLKSRRKAAFVIFFLAVAPFLVTFMPDKWFNRMETIGTYEEDSSATGRLNAWQMAFNLAKDRPLVGGGFQIYDQKIFLQYAPEPDRVHAAHSIYFAALGEHGFVGLGLFLLLGLTSWRSASWVARRARGDPDLNWAADLVQMIQVSLIGYAVGGAFVSVLYFDVPYYLIVAIVLVRKHVEEELVRKGEAKARELSRAAPVQPEMRPARNQAQTRERGG